MADNTIPFPGNKSEESGIESQEREKDPLASQPRTCKKCKKFIDASNNSKIDPQFCEECLHDVIVEDTVFTRTEIEYDEMRDTLKKHEQKCRQLKFGGQDYVWYTRTFASLDDKEAKAAIEYHRSCVAILENELLTRKVKQVQVNLNTPNTTYKRTTTTSTTKTTRLGGRKSKGSSNLTNPLDIAAAAMRAMGMSEAQVQAMLDMARISQNKMENTNAEQTGDTTKGTGS